MKKKKMCGPDPAKCASFKKKRKLRFPSIKIKRKPRKPGKDDGDRDPKVEAGTHQNQRYLGKGSGDVYQSTPASNKAFTSSQMRRGVKLEKAAAKTKEKLAKKKGKADKKAMRVTKRTIGGGKSY